jgi:GNAT superfamily N-acetyltransferase
LRFEIVPAEGTADPELREQLLGVWVDVTNAGGSVGFAAPAPVDQIAARLDTELATVATGRDALGVLRTDDGRAVGMGMLVARDADLFAHWRSVLRLMVHPSLQGRGGGRVLLEGLHDLGRELGLEHLYLSVRGGEGLEPFYEAFGYRVVGTHPGSVRLSPTDTRDEIFMEAMLRAGVRPANLDR